MTSANVFDSKTFVLIGRAGDGKSATGNTIIGRPCFALNLASGLQDCEKQCTSSIPGYSEVSVIDTPGLFNPKVPKSEVESTLKTIFDLAPNGIDAFLLVLRIGRFNTELQNTVKYFNDIFGDKVSKRTIVVFAGLDDLEFDEVTFDDYIAGLPDDIRKLIHYPKVAFNNRSKSPKDKQTQIELLLKEVDKLGNKTRYTKEDFPCKRNQQEQPIPVKEQPLVVDVFDNGVVTKDARDPNADTRSDNLKQDTRVPPKTKQSSVADDIEGNQKKGNSANVFDSKTLVLIGRAGDGKSSTGNSILGRPCFALNLASDLQECEKQCTSSIPGYSEVNVIDTPGLFNQKVPKSEVEATLKTVFDLAPNGIDAFLLVLRIGRLNAELQNAVKYFNDIFGDKVSKRTVVVFTGLDDLEFDELTFVDYIAGLPDVVRKLIHYPSVSFNNRSKSSKVKQNQIELLLNEVVNLGNKTRYTKEDFPCKRNQQEQCIPVKEQPLVEDKIGVTKDAVDANSGKRSINLKQDTREHPKTESPEDTQTQRELLLKEVDNLGNKARYTKEDFPCKRNQQEQPIPVKEHPLVVDVVDNGVVTKDARYPNADTRSDNLKQDTRVPPKTKQSSEAYDIGGNQKKGSSTNVNDSKSLVLIGRAGDGKSSTGNSILGRPCFALNLASDVQECEKQSTSCIPGYSKVSVIDTPGLFNPKIPKSEVEATLKTIFDLAPNGIDAFLLVLRIGRFNAELQNAVKYFNDIFGDKVSKHTVVVFTGLDDLDIDEVTFDDYIAGLHDDVRKLIPYPRVAFNNRSKSSKDKQTQIELLLNEVVNLRNKTRYTKEDFLCKRNQQEQPKTVKEQPIVVDNSGATKYASKQDTCVPTKTKQSSEVYDIKGNQKKATKQQLRIAVFQEDNADFVNKLEEVFSNIQKSVGENDPFTRLEGNIGGKSIIFVIIDLKKVPVGNKDVLLAAFEDVAVRFHSIILALSIGSGQKTMLHAANNLTSVLGNEVMKHTILAFSKKKKYSEYENIETYARDLPDEVKSALSIPIKAGKIWLFDKNHPKEAIENLVELIEKWKIAECIHDVAKPSHIMSPENNEQTRNRCILL